MPARATRVMVYLYKYASGYQERVAYVMTKDSTNVWSKTVSVTTLQATYGIAGTVYYGYRAWGPNWPYTSTWAKGSSAGFLSDVDASGNRFNPNKLLLDPYAREVSHDPLRPSANDGTIYASGPLYRHLDTGTKAPKGIVLKADTVSTGAKPTRAMKDDVVYEVHLRGQLLGLLHPQLLRARPALLLQQGGGGAHEGVASTASATTWPRSWATPASTAASPTTR